MKQICYELYAGFTRHADLINEFIKKHPKLKIKTTSINKINDDLYIILLICEEIDK